MSYTHPTDSEYIFFKILGKYGSNKERTKTNKNLKIKVHENECHLDFKKKSDSTYLKIEFPDAINFEIRNFQSIQCHKKPQNTLNSEIQNTIYTQCLQKTQGEGDMIKKVLEYLLENGEKHV
jgi:hypothetical protein